MPALLPMHLMRWITDHPRLFKPPVANKEVFPESEFIFQIVRGPNARNDFHIDPGDEIFYQLEGDITVEFIDADGKRQAARRRYEETLAREVVLVPFDRDAARSYASIRRDRAIRAPDAIQLACAARTGVDLFVTNDDRLSRCRVSGIHVIASLERAFL